MGDREVGQINEKIHNGFDFFYLFFSQKLPV